MNFNELNFELQHELTTLFSACPAPEQVISHFDSLGIPEEDWTLVSKALQGLSLPQAGIVFSALLNKITFADIAAGAGSTETLARLTALDVLSGVVPEKILFLVSFENQPEEIRAKLSALLPEKKDAFEKIKFATASLFLQDALKDTSFGQSLLVRLGMIEDFAYSSKWMEILSGIRNGINRKVYFWMVLNRKLTSSLSSVPEDLREDVEEIFRSYEVALEGRQLFDRVGMGDLIKRFYAFDRDFFLRHFSGYSRVLVDDAERFLPGEWPILKLFSKDGILTAAGDFSLAFYKPRDIEMGEPSEVFVSDDDYRHSPTVIECLSNMSGRQIVSSSGVADEAFVRYDADDEDDEMEFIAFQMKQIVARGGKAPDIGVVYERYDFPQKFSPLAVKYGLDCMEYPGAGLIIPLAEAAAGLLEKNITAPALEVLKKNFTPKQFSASCFWFEKQLRRFGPYDAIKDRNDILIGDLRKMKERSQRAVKLVPEYYSKAYQFDFVFVPAFENYTYPAGMKMIFYKIAARAAKGLFLTRPLKRAPKLYWKKPFETEASPLEEFLPSSFEKGGGPGLIGRVLKKFL
ncbi:MAG: hypothetical protein ABII20_00945 [Candidatus Omnitrophota bacterium]|nr:hypothetical protein [bacterium]